MKRTLALGTTSKHKVQAAQRAIDRLEAELALLPVSVASGVPEQPWGLEQTRQGAENRARGARLLQDADYGLGIESGLVPLGEEALDVAVLAFVERSGRASYATSVGVPFPSEGVRASRESGFTTTAGAAYAARTGADGTDPHRHLTPGVVSRSDLLEQAIFAQLAGLWL